MTMSHESSETRNEQPHSGADEGAEPARLTVRGEPGDSAAPAGAVVGSDVEFASGGGNPTSPADDVHTGQPDEDIPDVGFTLGGTTPAKPAVPEPDIPQQARILAHRIAHELSALGPTGWRRLHAGFALTVAGQLSRVVFFGDEQRQAQVLAPPSTLDLVAEHRRLSASLGDGPWWRLELSLSAEGELKVDHDYGDEPFPEDQTFGPQAYLADLETYPRATLPVWLAAYLRHDDRQSRTARQAAAAARADRENGVIPVVSEGDFPDFPLLWARWAAIAAAFVAIGSEWGPRVLPSFGWFEGSSRSGSSLYALPGGRAVLSGGVWNAPELDAAYNGGKPLPQLYRGAPEWVANPVLNTRAAGGGLTFCYWWDSGRWQRGESPSAADLAAAVPGMWTSGTTVDVIAGLLADAPTEAQRTAVAAFVAAAERRDATLLMLAEIFGATPEVDAAHYQLILAGVARIGPDPLPRAEAVALVRRHLESADTTGYPLDRLRADRLSVGWMVYVPTEPGEIALSRAIYYVADDGIVESATSSTPPSVYQPEFERRFRSRHANP